MPIQQMTDDRVLEVIVRSPGCTPEDIMLSCPDLTWNQVFIAIDHLSREGGLVLKPKGRGVYTLHLSNNAVHAARHHATV
jgi:hypothetical protein